MLGIIKSAFVRLQSNFSRFKEHPQANLITGIALGILGTALFNRSSSEIKAKVVRSLTAAAVTLVAYKTFAYLFSDRNLFDWRYHWGRFFSTSPKEYIRFDQLTNFGITRESIDGFENQIEEGDYSGLKSLLLSSGEVTLKQLKSAHFSNWMFPHLEEMLKRELFTYQECTLIHERFSDARLFECDQKSYRDSRGSVSHLALLMASRAFRKREGSSSEIPSPFLIKSFLERREIKPSSLKEATEMLTAFRYWQCGDVKKYFFQDQDWIQKLFPKCMDKATFIKLYASVNEIADVIADDEISVRIQLALFDCYLKYQGAKTAFHIAENRYVLPSRILSELASNQDAFQALLAKVNTLALDLSDAKEELGALRVLKATQPQLFEKISSLLLFTSPPTQEELFHELAELFLDINEIYLANYRLEEGAYHIDLNILEPLSRTFNASFHLIKAVSDNAETRLVVDDQDLLKNVSPFDTDAYTLYTPYTHEYGDLEFDLTSLPGFQGCYTVTPLSGEALADDFVEEDARRDGYVE